MPTCRHCEASIDHLEFDEPVIGYQCGTCDLDGRGDSFDYNDNTLDRNGNTEFLCPECGEHLSIQNDVIYSEEEQAELQAQRDREADRGNNGQDEMAGITMASTSPRVNTMYECIFGFAPPPGTNDPQTPIIRKTGDLLLMYCPHCNEENALSTKDYKKKVNCNECGGQFRVYGNVIE